MVPYFPNPMRPPPPQTEHLKSAAVSHNRFFTLRRAQGKPFMQSARFFYFFNFIINKKMKSIGNRQIGIGA